MLGRCWVDVSPSMLLILAATEWGGTTRNEVGYALQQVDMS